jgi:hypothetical protein
MIVYSQWMNWFLIVFAIDTVLAVQQVPSGLHSKCCAQFDLKSWLAETAAQSKWTDYQGTRFVAIDKWSRPTRTFKFVTNHGLSNGQEMVINISQHMARSSGPRSHEQWWTTSSSESETSAFDASGSVVWDSGITAFRHYS